MKLKRSLGVLAGLILLVLTACNKSELPSDNTIEGTYVGTLTADGLKSASGTLLGSSAATADITKSGDGQIEVHCYGDVLDTTFMLNYYDNHDSVMVCLTGDNFEEMYGHMLGSGHTMGGMMGDITNGETEWMHHMDDEHDHDDEHFGGFNMGNHTFSYTFRMMDGDNPYSLMFHGSKE
jgi:hypothetical protein